MDDSLESPKASDGIRKDSLKSLLVLTAMSLGCIYGDVGTSPLYVLNAIFPTSGPNPAREDVIGAVSAIFWSISIVPLIKYCFIALEFGNSTGEGGPFAVFTAIWPLRPEKDDRSLTAFDTKDQGARSHDKPNNSRIFRNVMFVIVLFGTCLTISDGLLTPAVSVTSAVAGIAVAVPSVINDVIPISIAILVALAIAQPFGIHRITFVFTPLVLLWLLTIGISGIVNVTEFPGIFRALDPSRAIMLFVRTKNYDLLNGVLLAITGTEAMFANLGQFSKGSIRLGFTALVYPCLSFAYLGQGALLITTPDTVLPNAFFNSIPGGVGNGLWWFTWILAVLATVIASQAMITATFSLVQQLVRFDIMPSLQIVHTTDRKQGQVYVPLANVLIMAGEIGLVAGFGTSANLTLAYGFAVSGVMIVTTCILTVAMIRLKGFPIYLALGYFCLSVFVDGLFFGSAIKKVPHGGWFPLSVAAALGIFFLFWVWSKGLERRFDALHRAPLSALLARGNPDSWKDTPSTALSPYATIDTVREVAVLEKYSPFSAQVKMVDNAQYGVDRLPVFAFFHNKSASTLSGVPHSFARFLQSYPALPQVIVFFDVRVVSVPHTEDAERYSVQTLRGYEGVYTATMFLGYRDPIHLDGAERAIRDRILAAEARVRNPDHMPLIRSTIDAALERAVTHILPQTLIVADRQGHNKAVHLVRKALIESVYHPIAVNFDDYEEYKFGDKSEVLRVAITAKV